MNGIGGSPGFDSFNPLGGAVRPEETLDEDHEGPRSESANASAIKPAPVPRRSGEARRLREADAPREAVEEVEFDGNLAALLDEVQRTLVRFVVIPVRETYALTLWIAHTHAFRRGRVTPYIEIRSPEKRCGKSTLLRVLASIVAKPRISADMSDAVLYRLVEREQPTLLWDGVDGLFGTKARDRRTPASS